MANLAAHAVVSHMTAKTDAANTPASAHAGGIDAIFAAVLAQMHAHPSDKIMPGAEGANVALPAGSQKKDGHKLAAAVLLPHSGHAPAQASAQEPKPGAHTPASGAAAALLSKLQNRTPINVAELAAGMKQAADAQKPGGHAIQPGQPHLPVETGAQADPRTAHPNIHMKAPHAVGPHATGPQDATGRTRAAALAASTNGANKTATTPPRARAASAHHAKTSATKDTAAATTKSAAALAAAMDKALHRTVPASRTAAALPPAAQATTRTDADTPSGFANSGGHDGQHNGGHAQAHAGHAEAAPPRPAAQGQAPAAQPFHAGAPTADPSASAQTAATTPSTSATVTAQLHVAPQSVNAPVPGQVAIPLADPGTLAIQIAAQSRNGAKQFDIALHPEELGSIHVRLNVDHSGAAQAHVRADNPQTLALLQRDSQALESALKDAGLNLAGNGLNFSLKGQERQNGNPAQQNTRGRRLSITAVASANPAPATAVYNLAPGSARLDIRV